MKFAICNETFDGWAHDRACQAAASLGYTGLEIAPFTFATDCRTIDAAARSDIRRTAESAGLQIIGLHWLLAKTEGFYLTTPDAAIRQATAGYLGALAELCRDLGGRVMVLGSPKQRNLLPGVTHDQALEFAADTLRQAMPTVEACDVVIAVEPLGPMEGDFLRTADLGAQLCEMVGSPHCRLHLDCKAMSTESTPIPEIVRKHARLLEHFHTNDPNLLGPGMGELDFHPILAALGEIDYRGWASVEVFDYKPGPERIARESIEYLKDCLAELAE